MLFKNILVKIYNENDILMEEITSRRTGEEFNELPKRDQMNVKLVYNYLNINNLRVAILRELNFLWGLNKELHKENDIIEISETLYERGYSALDLIEYIKELKIDEIKKYEYLVFFQKIKREFREERLLMACMLHFVLKRLDYSLENISFM